MNGELNIFGVFVPALLALAVIAFALSVLVRRVLAAFGLYRFVWHRALFDLSVFVILLAGLVALVRA